MEERKTKYDKVLQQHFGYPSLKPKQFEAIDNILHHKKDVCAILATGYGKSICYQLPYLIGKKCVIVVSPLIALMKDQYESMKKRGIPVCCLNSTTEYKNRTKGRIFKGEYKIIYMTPEYLIKSEEFIEELYEDHGVTCVAIDECHCISSWGSDFRPDYKELKVLKEWMPDVPILGLTATATGRVIEDICSSLQLEDPIVIKSKLDRPNLYISIQKKSKSIVSDISPLLEKHKDDFSIIYTKTRANTEKIAGLVREMGIKCEAYHAGLSDNLRNEIQQKFAKGKIKCIVATISFGMGIDQNVHLVCQYGCSGSIEAYYQEIGRAGRDGKPSDCYMFYSPDDFRINRYFLREIENISYRKYREEQILKMEKFVYSNTCRRETVLSYFGEKVKGMKCGNCDMCLNKTEIQKRDLTEQTFDLIKLISKVNCKYGITMLIDIIRGSKSKKIPVRFTKLDVYGKWKNYPLKWWKEFARILINNEYLRERVIIDGFGTAIEYTAKGKKWYNKMKRNKTNNTDSPTSSDRINDNDEYRLILEVTKELVELEPAYGKPIIFVDTKRKSGTTITIDTSTKMRKLTQTKLLSYTMFHEKGMSMIEIAKHRDFKKQTIEDHLVDAFKSGLELDLNKLSINKKIYDDVVKVVNTNNMRETASKSIRLKPIKDNIKGRVSYLQIKICLAIMEMGKETLFLENNII